MTLAILGLVDYNPTSHPADEHVCGIIAGIVVHIS